MRKTQAWLGKGPRRTSNTIPPKAETISRWKAQKTQRAKGRKSQRRFRKHPETGTISYAR